ncbi:helix-turn-helix domain-containing protein [Metabacillus litoralis]|uniref:Helix-turn-helix domain-containing protein n=1 Tax=Metabacillus litoralis TaxID=152268 RepID=A0A5C6V011_9BACI|nr:helix-turn-helix domain-containing protein [Metabacillus litoralis]TXC79023.1 helix-turn-helix domain-containing protein [Metabacillus litoralis]
MKNLSLSVSIILSGICFLIGTGLIANSITEANDIKRVEMNKEAIPEKQLLTKSELAIYLGLFDEELNKLISKDSNIPFIKIEGEVYYPKMAIDEWLLTGRGTYTKELIE